MAFSWDRIKQTQIKYSVNRIKQTQIKYSVTVEESRRTNRISGSWFRAGASSMIY
jgi:hypothetical protein